MREPSHQPVPGGEGSRLWLSRLNGLYLLYTLAFLALVATLWFFETLGLSREWIMPGPCTLTVSSWVSLNSPAPQVWVNSQ